MPAGIVKTPEDERHWSEAKKRAAEEGHAKDYAYIMGIFKRMSGKKSLRDRLVDLIKAKKPIPGQMGLFGGSGPKPPAGFQPLAASKHGGYYKLVGGKRVYWYPETGKIRHIWNAPGGGSEEAAVLREMYPDPTAAAHREREAAELESRGTAIEAAGNATVGRFMRQAARKLRAAKTDDEVKAARRTVAIAEDHARLHQGDQAKHAEGWEAAVQHERELEPAEEMKRKYQEAAAREEAQEKQRATNRFNAQLERASWTITSSQPGKQIIASNDREYAVTMAKTDDGWSVTGNVPSMAKPIHVADLESARFKALDMIKRAPKTAEDLTPRKLLDIASPTPETWDRRTNPELASEARATVTYFEAVNKWLENHYRPSTTPETAVYHQLAGKIVPAIQEASVLASHAENRGGPLSMTPRENARYVAPKVQEVMDLIRQLGKASSFEAKRQHTMWLGQANNLRDLASGHKPGSKAHTALTRAAELSGRVANLHGAGKAPGSLIDEAEGAATQAKLQHEKVVAQRNKAKTKAKPLPKPKFAPPGSKPDPSDPRGGWYLEDKRFPEESRFEHPPEAFEGKPPTEIERRKMFVAQSLQLFEEDASVALAEGRGVRFSLDALPPRERAYAEKLIQAHKDLGINSPKERERWRSITHAWEVHAAPQERYLPPEHWASELAWLDKIGKSTGLHERLRDRLQKAAPMASAFKKPSGPAGIPPGVKFGGNPKERIPVKPPEQAAKRGAVQGSVVKPPGGFTPIPHSKKGGYHKQVGGGKYIYWYPGQGIVKQADEADAGATPHQAATAQHVADQISALEKKGHITRGELENTMAAIRNAWPKGPQDAPRHIMDHYRKLQTMVTGAGAAEGAEGAEPAPKPAGEKAKGPKAKPEAEAEDAKRIESKMREAAASQKKEEKRKKTEEKRKASREKAILDPKKVPEDFNKLPKMERANLTANWDQVKEDLDKNYPKGDYLSHPDMRQAITEHIDELADAGDIVPANAGKAKDMLLKQLEYGEKAGIKKEVLASLLEENVRKLAHQEVESVKRTLGDHGVRHLSVNAHQANRIFDQLEKGGIKISAMDRFMAHQVMIDHDMGYTIPVIAKGGFAIKDNYHPQASAVLASQQADKYKKLFGDRFKDYLVHVESHSGNRVDWKDDPIGSAVRLADNTHLFADKLPEVLFDTNEGIEILTKIKLASQMVPATLETVDDKGNKVMKRTDAEKAELKALIGGVKDQLAASIRSREDLPKHTKELLASAVAELGELTPKFMISRLAGREPKFEYSKKTGNMAVNIEQSPARQAIGEIFGDDETDKQFHKMLEDFGTSPSKVMASPPPPSVHVGDEHNGINFAWKPPAGVHPNELRYARVMKDTKARLSEIQAMKGPAKSAAMKRFFGAELQKAMEVLMGKLVIRKGLEGMEKASAGPFIGPRGGKWADAKHTIPWKEGDAGVDPWKDAAKKLLDASKHEGQHGLHYRAYMRAIMDGQPTKHLTDQFEGARAARADLIDERGRMAKSAMAAVAARTGRERPGVGKPLASGPSLRERLSAAVGRRPPGAGWSPISGGKKGGFRKMVGGKFVYWYPGMGKEGGSQEEAERHQAIQEITHHEKQARKHQELSAKRREQGRHEAADASRDQAERHVAEAHRLRKKHGIASVDVGKSMVTKEGKELHFGQLEAKIRASGGASDPAAVAAKVYRRAGGVPDKTTRTSKKLAAQKEARKGDTMKPEEGEDKLSKPMEKASSGEGSRGGHVVGHTAGGKPIYERRTNEHIAAMERHKSHLDTLPKRSMSLRGTGDPHAQEREAHEKAYQAHRNAAIAHSGGYHEPDPEGDMSDERYHKMVTRNKETANRLTDEANAATKRAMDISKPAEKSIRVNRCTIHLGDDAALAKAIESGEMGIGTVSRTHSSKSMLRKSVAAGEGFTEHGADHRESVARAQVDAEVIRMDPAGNDGNGGLASWFEGAQRTQEPMVRTPAVMSKAQEPPTRIIDDSDPYTHRLHHADPRDGQANIDVLHRDRK